MRRSTALHDRFPRIFEAGHIGSLELPNRIVMSPMGTLFASDSGAVTPKLIDHYKRRAQGGVGLVIVEFTCVDYPRGKGHAAQLAIHDDKLVAGHADLVDAVHRSGAKVMLQLHHAGGKTNRSWTEGILPVAPSLWPGRPAADQPHVLTVGEIDDLTQKFVRGAERARLAGYDGIELHAAHGYLLAQFMSAYVNSREDDYGGSLENRMRFLLDVIRRSKAAVGNDFPLIVRFSGREFVPRGRSIEETKQVARMLESAGVSALHVSAGFDSDSEWIVDPIDHPQGAKLDLAAEVKGEVSIPVIAVGAIKEPEFAERALEEGKADFLALGRALLVDPDWVRKAADPVAGTISKCIGCNFCTSRVDTGLSLRCALNPAVGDPYWEQRLAISPVRHRVAVLGGGPAGMEAARVAALRGHEVFLYERAAELGGQLLLARLAPAKDKLNWLIDDLRLRLAESGAHVQLNCETSPSLIADLHPDVVVFATGGRPARPPIPGIEGPSVLTAWDVLRGSAIDAGPVVVIGGGCTGCDVAIDLASRGIEVDLVEQFDAIATDLDAITRSERLKQIEADPMIRTHTRSRGLEVTADGLRVSTDGVESLLPARWIVLAAGIQPVRDLRDAVSAGDGRYDVYEIGDCLRPRSFAAALDEGRAVGCQI